MIMREILFYVSTAYGYVNHLLCVRTWYSRVNPHVVLGALPLRSFWPKIESKEQITHILSMLEPFEVKSFVLGPNEAHSRGLQHLSLPVRDFIGVPSWEQVKMGISFIENCVKQNACVYVHCKAGRTRSAFLVACYLMYCEGLNADLAMQRLVNCRPYVKLTKTQWAALRRYSVFLAQKPTAVF